MTFVDFLVKLFNMLFDDGIFPEDWFAFIILPLFKKGAVSDPNNYRCISLCDICSKWYSIIINKIQEMIQEDNITGEWQAGFKKEYPTTDHIFTLPIMIQKQFLFKRKLYMTL